MKENIKDPNIFKNMVYNGNIHNKIKSGFNEKNLNEGEKIKNKCFSKAKIAKNTKLLQIQINKQNFKGKSVKKKKIIIEKENLSFIKNRNINIIRENYNTNKIPNPTKRKIIDLNNTNLDYNINYTSEKGENINIFNNKAKNDININNNELFNDNKEKLEEKTKEEMKKKMYNNKENEELKIIIEILLLLKKFKDELENKIRKSLNSPEIIIEECILLKKEWIDNFYKIYFNEEIEGFIKKSFSVNSIIILMKHKENYIAKISESNLIMSPNDIINLNRLDISKSEKIGDIYYQKNFYMINDEIFKRLINYFQKDNLDELNEQNVPKIKYIINNGSIIFSYNYIIMRKSNEDRANFYYNLLILEKYINNNIIIQNFEEKKERDVKFEEYKTGKYLYNENIQNSIKVIRPTMEEEYKKDLMILILLFRQILICRRNIKQENNLKELKIKEYYIIDKNWMNELLVFFEFSHFISLINNKLNFETFIEFEFEEDKIFPIFKNDAKINDKIKLKNEFINQNKYYLEKEIKTVSNINVQFFNNFELINEEIKKLIDKFINIKIDSKTQFLLIDKYIFANVENENYLILGKLNKDLSFQANIVFNFIIKLYKDRYIDKIKRCGKEEIYEILLKLYNQDIFTFPNKDGKAFKIYFDEEIKNILDFKKDESIKQTLKKYQENLNAKNDKKVENLYINEYLGNNGTEKDEGFEENKNILKNQTVDNLAIKDIKTLISYYFFTKDLEENIQQSSSNSNIYNIYDCYLINNDFQKKLKKFIYMKN